MFGSLLTYVSGTQGVYQGPAAVPAVTSAEILVICSYLLNIWAAGEDMIPFGVYTETRSLIQTRRCVRQDVCICICFSFEQDG